MKLGVVLHYNEKFEAELQWLSANGITTCQLGISPKDQTEQIAKEIKKLTDQYGVTITAMVGSWSGPGEWNFTAGPLTLGIVPVAYRGYRLKELMVCADFAAQLGVGDLCTHMGFIPENPCDALYMDVVAALRSLAGYYREKGIRLNFETGQETPTTLLRVLTDVGLDNVGLNYDPANLLMYGKANPIDGLDIVGKYVNGVHAKDGEYPTNPRDLGCETALGDGRVDFPRFIAKLKEVGYDGALTIEREISGDQQKEDILKAKRMLEALL